MYNIYFFILIRYPCKAGAIQLFAPIELTFRHDATPMCHSGASQSTASYLQRPIFVNSVELVVAQW